MSNAYTTRYSTHITYKANTTHNIHTSYITLTYNILHIHKTDIIQYAKYTTQDTIQYKIKTTHISRTRHEKYVEQSHNAHTKQTHHTKIQYTE